MSESAVQNSKNVSFRVAAHVPNVHRWTCCWRLGQSVVGWAPRPWWRIQDADAIYWSDVDDGVIAATGAPAEWIWSRDDDDSGPAMRQRKSSERLVTRFGDPPAGNQGDWLIDSLLLLSASSFRGCAQRKGQGKGEDQTDSQMLCWGRIERIKNYGGAESPRNGAGDSVSCLVLLPHVCHGLDLVIHTPRISGTLYSVSPRCGPVETWYQEPLPALALAVQGSPFPHPLQLQSCNFHIWFLSLFHCVSHMMTTSNRLSLG